MQTSPETANIFQPIGLAFQRATYVPPVPVPVLQYPLIAQPTSASPNTQTLEQQFQKILQQQEEMQQQIKMIASQHLSNDNTQQINPINDNINDIK